MLALAAHDNQIPVYCVFPSSTVDMTLSNGKEIPIEERDTAEVLQIKLKGKRVTPLDASARNPAFDVTPSRLLNGYVTEVGIIEHPFEKNYPLALERNSK
jgi:methylthioribose-1-phosphate isomerase